MESGEEDNDDKYAKKKRSQSTSDHLKIIYGFLGLNTVLLFLIFLLALFLWIGVPSSPKGSTSNCQVKQCTTSSDIIPIIFINGVTNVTSICNWGSTTIIYIPPTDPLNFDFGTPSFNAAFTACKRCLNQSFTYPPAIIPYMANDPTGKSTGVYNKCSLVFECSFDMYYHPQLP